MVGASPNVFTHRLNVNLTAQVSDNWIFPACAAACKAALLAQHSYNQMFAFRDLPSQFDSMIFQVLKQQAEHVFISKFCNAPAVLACPQTLRLLTKQPHAFMLALLRDSRLCTDAEATVLLLLRAWLLSHNCSKEELAELKQEIRYGCLDYCYLWQVLPLIPELEVSREQERELVSRKTGVISHLPIEVRTTYPSCCPPTWFQKRPRPASTPSMISIQMVVSRKALLSHAAAVVAMQMGGKAPDRIFGKVKLAHGYEWRLFLASDTLATAFSVGVGVKIPFSDTVNAAQACMIQVKALIVPTAHTGEQLLGQHEQKLVHKETSWPDCFRNAAQVKAGDTTLEPWRKFVGKGDICVSALVVCIDVKGELSPYYGHHLYSINEEFAAEGGLDEIFVEEDYHE